jgi:hypothetical protein
MRVPRAAAPLEHDIQRAFFDWVRLAEGAEPRLKLMFAVPNGGLRSAKTAGMLKAEGVRAGVLDVLFPCASSGFRGLAIEFKRPGNTTTDAQDKFIGLLINEQWFVTVCTDTLTAINVVKDYLGGRLG